MADKKKHRAPQTSGKGFFSRNIYAIVVAAMAFFLYASTISNGYNLDDELVTRNHPITSKGWQAIKPNFDAFSNPQYQGSPFKTKAFYFLPEVLRTPYYSDEMGYSYDYRPVVIGSFALEFALFGDNAGVSHFFNVLLYALSCLLFFLVIKKLMPGRVLLSFAIAIAFVTFPVHTEVVASIKNRDELLGLFFAFGSWLFLLRAWDKKRPVPAYACAFLLFLFATLSKQNYTLFALIIPAGTVFFRNTDFKGRFIAGVIYSVPVFLFYSSSSGLFKIALTGVVIIAPQVAHLYNNFSIKDIYEKVKALFSLAGTTGQLNKNLEPENLKKSFYFFRLRPGSSEWAIGNKWALAPALLIFAGAAVLYFFIGIPYFLLAMAIGAIVYLVSKEEVQRWLGVALVACYLVGFHVFVATPIADIVVSVFIIFSFYNHRHPVTRCLYVLLVLAYILIKPAAFPAVLVFFLVAWPLSRRSALLLLAAEGVVMAILKVAGIPLDLSSWLALVPLNLPILIARIEKQPLKLEWFGKICVLAMALALVLQIPKEMERFAQGAKELQAAKPPAGSALISNPIALIGAHQDRPIDFIEFPLDPATGPIHKLGISGVTLLHYYRLSAVPYPMSFYYGYKYFDNVPFTSPTALLGWLITLVLLIAALLLHKRHRVFSFAIFLYVFSVLPFSNLLQPIAGVAGDRYLLIPSIGFVVAVIYCLFYFFKRLDAVKLSELKGGLTYIFAALVMVYVGLTVKRNFEWKDDLTLFRHDIAHLEESAQAHNLLALHLMQAATSKTGNALRSDTVLSNEAITHFKKATEIYPKFFNAYFSLGRAYAITGKLDNALTAFNEALKLDSTYDEIHNYISAIYLQQGKYTQAIPYLQRMIRDRPTEETWYARLDSVYRKTGDYRQSIAVYQLEAQNMPQSPVPLSNIGNILYDHKEYEEAEVYFKQLVEKWPADYGGYDKLSYLYYKMGKINRAIEVNEDAAAKMPSNADPIVNVGRIYQMVGKPDSALIYFNKGLVILPNSPEIKKLIESVPPAKP